MTSEQKRAIEIRFQQIFKIPFDEGLKQVAILLRRSARFGVDPDLASMEYSRISMTERDFSLIAFFAFMGAEALDDLGIKKLPPSNPFKVPGGERLEHPVKVIHPAKVIDVISRIPPDPMLQIEEGKRKK